MEIKNFKSADKFVILIDHLSKKVFDGAAYGKTIEVCEKKDHRTFNAKTKKNEVTDINSTFKLTFQPPKALADDNLKPTPLTMFDRAVYNAIVSEKYVGNDTMSIASIFRLISGKASGNKPIHSLYESQFDLIIESLKKLMSVRISLDNAEAYKILKLKGGVKIENRPILKNAELISPLDGVLNGQPAALFYMPKNTEPFLFHFAELKEQLLTIDRKLLDTGRLQNSADAIAVKHCVLYRALEKNLKPVIRLDYVFEKCGIDFKKCNSRAAVSYKKQTLRNIMTAVMENLKTAGKISTYKWTDKFYSIEFTKPEKAKKSKDQY